MGARAVTRGPVADGYVLGHAARELDRLDLQGALYRDATLHALLAGGVTTGVRVLDLGSGSGDVALLASEVVGARGWVTGVERDEGSVAAARVRASARGATNVDFHLGDVAGPVPGAPFDALVGRFILMHQPDPAATLRSALANIRDGGPVVLLESHMALLLSGTHSFPFSPTYDQAVRWMCRVLEAAGADLASGLRLPAIFREAGLPAPVTRLDAVVDGRAESLLYRYVAESVASMLPAARRLGIDGFDEVLARALADRLRAEVAESGGVLMNWPVVAAWSRVARS